MYAHSQTAPRHHIRHTLVRTEKSLSQAVTFSLLFPFKNEKMSLNTISFLHSVTHWANCITYLNTVQTVLLI